MKHAHISWSFGAFWVSFASCGFSGLVNFGVFVCFLFVLMLNLLFWCLLVILCLRYFCVLGGVALWVKGGWVLVNFGFLG